jgi:peptidoglycan/xylan/chitin deacetylase (PgdA/CDA1 family)
MKKAAKIFIIACVLFGVFFALNYFQGIRHAAPTAYISITFDDAYVSQYDAAQMLESYNYRGTFYIPAAFIGAKFEGKDVMNWAQIEDLQKSGHEIGSHTWNHTKASSISEDVYEKEVYMGKEELEDNGIKVKNFAYPYGDDSKKEITLKYFDTARGTKPCINRFSDKELCGLTLVHQFDEYKILSVYLADLKLSGGWLVIVIHDISDNPRADIDITNEEFSWILEQIKKSGISVKTVAEVANETA